MAEVQDKTQAAEPSMEEILASIRRIISDDEPVTADGVPAEDVIELTQAVQDDGSVVDVREEPPPPPPPPEPVMVAPATEPPKPPVVETAPPPAEALVSEPKIDVAASALSSLASTVEIERLASEPRNNMYMGNGYRTLEDMTVELMRPLLKQWLDENLPATVERLVQKEIERISRRAKD
jgi:cell pole-organizing protein PopZ